MSDEKEVHPVQGIESISICVIGILEWGLGLWGIEPEDFKFLEEIFQVKEIQLSS